MKFISFLGVLLLLCFLSSSCESEHKIDLPYHHPRLVINGLLKADSPVEFYVSASSNMGEFDNRNIVGVTIRFYENGKEIFPEVERKEALFKTNWIVQSGVRAGIEIEAPGYESITAEDIVPHPAWIRVVEHKPKVGVYTDGDYYSEMVFRQTDEPDKDKYYEIYILNDFGTSKTRDWGWINLGRNEDESNMIYGNTPSMADTITMSCYYFVDYEDVTKIFHFRTVTLDYYLYKKSWHRQQHYLEGAGLWSGAVNPTELHTNVKGGFGIWAGYTQQVDSIFIPVDL